MKRAYRPITVGVALLFGAIALDLAGSSLQSLPLLIVSFASAIAGAVIAISGIVELVAERV